MTHAELLANLLALVDADSIIERSNIMVRILKAFPLLDVEL